MSYENFWFVQGPTGPPDLEQLARDLASVSADFVSVSVFDSGSIERDIELAYYAGGEHVGAVLLRIERVGAGGVGDRVLDELLTAARPRGDRPSPWTELLQLADRLAASRWVCMIRRPPKGRFVDETEDFVMQSYPQGVMYREGWGLSRGFDWGNDHYAPGGDVTDRFTS